MAGNCGWSDVLVLFRGVKQAKGQSYIKISEEEIADDYPVPKQYEMQEEEIDEFVVNGDENIMLEIDPESLPTMVRLCCQCCYDCTQVT